MTEIKKVLLNYNLDIENIEILDKGYATKKWIIYTKDNQKYILKKIDKQTPDRVEYILKVQYYLKQYCPQIIKTTNNMLYYKENNNTYYLCEYLECNQFILNQNKLFELGNLLANLHNKMKDIKLNKSTFLKIEDNHDILSRYLNYYQKNNDLIYRDIVQYKLNILQELKYNNINFNKLNEQIIHGDFYECNILHTKVGYKIIDFDQSCHFYKEYEIMRAMFMICINKDLEKKHILANMKKFIKGYIKENNITSPTDAYNLYLFIQANSLSSIKPEDRNNEMKYNFALKRYEILKILYENKTEIIKILGE